MKRILVTGANGQLGRALKSILSNAIFLDKEDLDITSDKELEDFPWDDYKCIINTAAYTNVDGAELDENKDTAWLVNSESVQKLAKKSEEFGLTLVHISSDYVFDGKKSTPYLEDDLSNPLSIYGKTKLAGDDFALKAPKSYVLRTSWVIGDGKNFIRTMLSLGQREDLDSLKVVNDQVGRPTFTQELARAILFILNNSPPYGLYNLTNDGAPISWAELADKVFIVAGVNKPVIGISSKEYFADKPLSAYRPKNSVLSLEKIKSVGFFPNDWSSDLKEYINEEVCA